MSLQPAEGRNKYQRQHFLFPYRLSETGNHFSHLTGVNIISEGAAAIKQQCLIQKTERHTECVLLLFVQIFSNVS